MKNWKKLSLFVLLLSGLACKKTTTAPEKDTFVPISVGTFLDNWTCSINPGVGANFDIGEFRLWVPDASTVSNLKAVMVLLDRVNSNGLSMVNDTTWRKYAIENNIALLAVHLENAKLPTTYPYADARNGSGAALIMALEAIAQKNNIPTVGSLPFLIRGYSAGGMFAYYFSAFKPARVVAFTNIRGWYITEIPDDSKLVPALFLMGDQDTMTNVPPDNVQQLVIQKRYAGALWGFALEPGASHYSSLSRSDSLTKQFFSVALKKRVAGGSTALIAIPQETGWLGNNALNNAVPYDNYTGNKKEASWLAG